MKYQQEYNETDNIVSFVKLVLKHYPTHKEISVKRRYYDLRKLSPPDLKTTVISSLPIFFEQDDLQEISLMKKLTVQDMIRLKANITKDFLLKHGFTPREINWIKYKMEVEVKD